jgi:hypothetical protein
MKSLKLRRRNGIKVEEKATISETNTTIVKISFQF